MRCRSLPYTSRKAHKVVHLSLPRMPPPKCKRLWHLSHFSKFRPPFSDFSNGGPGTEVGSGRRGFKRGERIDRNL
ncbi:uncharacterized protein A1O5_11488 [Cladophialophora psammophila CBS 110553]|uniref:Uncharacterized protein n=1 Tax=Cladophialophora psammophila CBS 110553 TaxID=1182543 RepID=W9WYX2_9EURO|nr:uncharacterized protein A1O5_11488 [Cladophialophora psammophila CBS 110553]EXJ63439.1 hypothetical protein A1O5_11488 [Cladophialophora psammophila CBS 110553]